MLVETEHDLVIFKKKSRFWTINLDQAQRGEHGVWGGVWVRKKTKDLTYILKEELYRRQGTNAAGW